MYLGLSEIIELIRELSPPLVEGLSPYQLVPAESGGTAEGPCVELRIGRVLEHDPEDMPVLGVDTQFGSAHPAGYTRYVPEARDVQRPLRLTIGDSFDLPKGSSILVESIERINLPNSEVIALLGQIEPRFSLGRIGIMMLKSDADPGYRGHVLLRLLNVGPFNVVRLSLGARIAKLRFARVSGVSPTYVGRYGGVSGGISEER